MTETEKRRITLLEQTRETYSAKNTPPAIHPRYIGAYQSIYKTENRSTFGIRLILAVLLFGLFVAASYNNVKEVERVSGEIQRELSELVDLKRFR